MHVELTKRRLASTLHQRRQTKNEDDEDDEDEDEDDEIWH